MDIETFNIVCYAWLALAVVIHFVLFRISAPFGRHTTKSWGPMVNNKVAWIVMEFPSLAIMVYFALQAAEFKSDFSLLLFGLWIIHYTNRTFIYPLRIKPTNKKMPAVIMLNAVIFNLINAGLNGYFLAFLASDSCYGLDWLFHPLTVFGFVLFAIGLMINWRSDHILINLRKPGETGYVIPKGFLFNFVSSPNLLGEIIEWIGFAVMAWNLPALTFAVWTYANLVPRAKDHHDWYHRKFDQYPSTRKRIFSIHLLILF